MLYFYILKDTSMGLLTVFKAALLAMTGKQ